MAKIVQPTRWIFELKYPVWTVKRTEPLFLKKRQPELARALSLQNCEGAGADAGRSGEKDACADRTDPERSLHDPVLIHYRTGANRLSRLRISSDCPQFVL
jgi:hypothetical protein